MSTVYGSSETILQRLRSFRNGLMKTNSLGPTMPTRVQGGINKDGPEGKDPMCSKVHT